MESCCYGKQRELGSCLSEMRKDQNPREYYQQDASVSAYVADALTEKVAGETLEQFLADWRKRAGEPTPEDNAWAERALGARDSAT